MQCTIVERSLDLPTRKTLIIEQSILLLTSTVMDQPSLTMFFSDLDECLFSTHACDRNSACVDTDGSYNCVCFDGYKGNGFTCTGKRNVLTKKNACNCKKQKCPTKFGLVFSCMGVLFLLLLVLRTAAIKIYLDVILERLLQRFVTGLFLQSTRLC